MYSPVHRTNKSIHSTTLPCDWPSESVRVYFFYVDALTRKTFNKLWHHYLVFVFAFILVFATAKTQFPFANSGIDFFGPFYIEDSKGVIEKHYGLIFTCMVTRAVHLETCPDLNTDTFLNAFRRFCCRRCQPQLLYSDIGKTFVGASEELKKTVQALNNDRMYKALAVVNTTWKFNPPYGPHFGGVWERLIQSAKKRSP